MHWLAIQFYICVIFSQSDCAVLQPPEYGSVIPVLSNPLHGNNVTFSCNDGYNLLGSAESTCMPNGEWSGTTVTCQGNLYKTSRCNYVYSSVTFVNIATCKIEDATKNEKVRVEPVSSQYIQDDQIIIVCDSGYHMSSSSDPILMRICLSNQTWSGIDPICEEGISTLLK